MVPSYKSKSWGGIDVITCLIVSQTEMMQV